MVRPKKIIDEEIVAQAKRELTNLPDHQIHLRLLAIIKAGERSIGEVADFLLVSRNTVSNWIRRFRHSGLQGLYDRPKGHNPSKLKEEHKQVISQWLDADKNSRGMPVHWTIEKLQGEIQREWGIIISYTPLRIQLKKLGFKIKIPRPVHAKADPVQQADFKKNS